MTNENISQGPLCAVCVVQTKNSMKNYLISSKIAPSIMLILIFVFCLLCAHLLEIACACLLHFTIKNSMMECCCHVYLMRSFRLDIASVGFQPMIIASRWSAAARLMYRHVENASSRRELGTFKVFNVAVFYFTKCGGGRKCTVLPHAIHATRFGGTCKSFLVRVTF